jgi:arabinofuranosyltransferase
MALVGLTGALVLIYAIVLVRTAWLCDDAYITYRTIDNFVNGHGMVWNVGERVQVFTHPLWMLLLSAAYFFTREIYLTAMAVSMLVSVAAVTVSAFGVARNAAAAAVAIAALLVSKSFIDFSTSGLENPLTFLFLAAFAAFYFGSRDSKQCVFPCALIAGLAMTNRMDSILFFAPALAWISWEARSVRMVAQMAAGFTPFIAWTAFATFYYGFPFPNTAYAKLNTGVPALESFQEGFGDFISALQWTPFSITLVLAGFVLPFVLRDWRALPFALGSLLYVVYFMRVGGDFMVGRFFSGPVFASVLLLSRMPLSARHVLPAMVFIAAAGMMGPYPTVLSDASYGQDRASSGKKMPFRDIRNLSDLRAVFYGSTGLLRAPGNGWEPTHAWVKAGEQARGRGGVIVHGAVGYRGYYAGPDVHIIDYYALGDPLLARLPLHKNQGWRSGHYTRKLPEGYRETIESGENRIKDTDLAAYYDTLCIITQGSLWRLDRLATIWRMNTGVYAPLIDAYAQRRPGGSMAHE